MSDDAYDYLSLDRDDAEAMRVPRMVQAVTAVYAGLEAAEYSAGSIVGVKSPLEAYANSKEFVDRYGLTFDGKPFDWTLYPHLVDLYEDEHDELVIMAGAQTGKSMRLNVKLLRSAIERWGGLFGYYFPDKHLPASFSRDRFAPFVRSNDQLAPWLGRDIARRKGADQTLTRRFGASAFYFLTTGGKTSTEGLPMAGVFFDEVRRIKKGDLQRAEERTSAQWSPINVKVSTANLPKADIHAAFVNGDQRHFHSACECDDGVVLSLTWPNCIADMTIATPLLKRKVEHAFHEAGLPYLGLSDVERQRWGEAALICPKCSQIIVNPRDGWWERHNPKAYAHSYQLPQLLSPQFSASRAWKKWTQGEGDDGQPVDLMELWNSLLGLPYMDPSAQPVQIEHLLGCCRRDIPWPVHKGERWMRENLRNVAMGFDVQKGYNVVVLKMLAPNKKFRTIHLEIASGGNPWKECARLMERFNVRACVCDAQPEYDSAFQFARTFEGRVWLAYYVDGERMPMVNWGDRTKLPPGQKQTAEETKFKYTVNLHRTKVLKWSLNRWVKAFNEVPDPNTLVQMIPVQNGKPMLTPNLRTGTPGPVRICRDLYFEHQMKVGFFREEDDDDRSMGKVKLVARHLENVDPHYCHANSYADIALARIGHPRALDEGQEDE